MVQQDISKPHFGRYTGGHTRFSYLFNYRVMIMKMKMEKDRFRMLFQRIGHFTLEKAYIKNQKKNLRNLTFDILFTY